MQLALIIILSLGLVLSGVSMVKTQRAQEQANEIKRKQLQLRLRGYVLMLSDETPIHDGGPHGPLRNFTPQEQAWAWSRFYQTLVDYRRLS